MKPVRTFILGSAAGLLAVGGAQAADLPVKAKAVEYVRICSLYGAGFFYIPGTDTCIKLGGYLRADITFKRRRPRPAGLERRFRPAESLSRLFHRPLAHGADDRYPYRTEYGVVRTFGPANFQFTNLGSSRNPAVLNTSVLNASSGLGAVANNAQLLDTAGGGYVAIDRSLRPVRRVHVRQVGFGLRIAVAGQSGRQPLVVPAGRPEHRDTGANNIQYTTQFGNGVSATHRPR